MAKQVDEKVDKSVIYTSFDKSEKEQWLYNIASGNIKYKTIPKKSTLMKMALEFYLDCLGIRFNPKSVSKNIPQKLNSSKIEYTPKINVEQLVEKPKELVQEIQDDDIGNGFIDT